jgi:F-type H+-transporting ATPase subunit b
MGTVLLLATEASREGGFGFNFDILETNLINLVIIIAVLFYFGRGFVGKILTERRSGIEGDSRSRKTPKRCSSSSSRATAKIDSSASRSGTNSCRC